MRLGLSIKIVLSVALLAIVLFASLAYMSLTSRKSDLINLYTEGARVTSYSLSSNINNIEDLQDKDHLFLMIKNMIWLDADVVNIHFTLPQGNEMFTYVSNDSISDGRKSDSENLEAYKKDVFINKIVRSGDSQLLKVFAPLHISGKVVGTVQINFTLESINSKTRAAVVNLVIEFVVMTLVFLLLVYLILRLIVINPIHKLSEGLQAIQNKDFDYKVHYSARDEFGDLVDFFNKTTVILKENDALSKSRNQELEILVSARTQELSQKVHELEQINGFMVDREIKMVELKNTITELEAKIEKSH